MSAEAPAKQVIVPIASSHAVEDYPSSTTEVLGNSSELPPSQPRGRKDFAPVEKPSSQSARIIRVTIGRVEVRAIHPIAPASKPAKPQTPKLSLEEYLRKRQRGSR